MKTLALAILAALLAALLAAAFGCSDSGSDPGPAREGGVLAGLTDFAAAPEYDKEDVLISLTDLAIVPGYEAVAHGMSGLDAAIADLCAAPSQPALDAARSAWRDARAAWSRSASTWFGPVMERRSLGVMDWSPVEPERIERMLAERPATSESQIRDSLGSTMRGLGAVEYMLFAEGAPDSLSSRPERCGYLTALGNLIASEADAILREWTVEREYGPAYAGFFTGRASSSMLSSEAFAEVVRTQVFLLRTITDMRLAAALGLREGGADPAAMPGGAGENALADLRAQILGIRDMYAGRDSEGALGVSHIVAPLSSETDARMRRQLDESIAAIEGVEGPLSAALTERPEQIQAVHDRLSELRITLDAEVVALLGISVGFSDTDGDSAK